MKSNIIFVIAALLSFSAAYSTPGAYERMWLYYSYLADVELGGGTAPMIAAGCPKSMGTGGKPCSFNQFVAYIERSSKPYSLTNDKMPDVETMAQELEAKGYTRAYDITRVYPGLAKGSKFNTLFTKLGTYLSSSVLFAVDDSVIKDSIKHALTAVARTRITATMDVLEKKFTDNDLTPKWTNIPVYDGADEQIRMMDLDATIEA